MLNNNELERMLKEVVTALLMYHLHICLKELRNTKENLDHDLNLGPPKHAAGVPAIQQHTYAKTHEHYIVSL
jgi:hypothetical protein